MIRSSILQAIKSLPDEGTNGGVVDGDGIIEDPTPLEQITVDLPNLADILFIPLPAMQLRTPIGINQ